MPTYQSQSDGELLEEETSCGAARRRVAKKKHTRRRSGSLSRVLSVMGKAIGLGRTPGNSKGGEEEAHEEKVGESLQGALGHGQSDRSGQNSRQLEGWRRRSTRGEGRGVSPGCPRSWAKRS